MMMRVCVCTRVHVNKYNCLTVLTSLNKDIILSYLILKHKMLF